MSEAVNRHDFPPVMGNVARGDPASGVCGWRRLAHENNYRHTKLQVAELFCRRILTHWSMASAHRRLGRTP